MLLEQTGGYYLDVLRGPGEEVKDQKKKKWSRNWDTTKDTEHLEYDEFTGRYKNV